MTHLTMEQLLALREPGLEPGLEAARQHLDTCPACQAEHRGLDQRVARLRALAMPRPGRNQFPLIRADYVRARRRSRLVRGGIATLALAASALLAVVSGRAGAPDANPATVATDAAAELDAVVARSQQLEEALRLYDPDSRVVDARTATIAARLEDQLSILDREIELASTLDRHLPERHTRQLRLWHERVGLLDALMDVHLTRASFAGM